MNDSSKQSQFRGPTWGEDGDAKQTQYAPGPAAGTREPHGQLYETKPIRGGRQGWDALATNALRHYEPGLFCETKPITGVVPPRRGRAWSAKQSQTWAGWGTWRRLVRQAGAKQSQLAEGRRQAGGERVDDLVKQSQFGLPDRGEWRRSAYRAKQSPLPGPPLPAGGGRGLRNKANLACQARPEPVPAQAGNGLATHWTGPAEQSQRICLLRLSLTGIEPGYIRAPLREPWEIGCPPVIVQCPGGMASGDLWETNWADVRTQSV